jgi:HSP20 family protein
MTLIKWNNPAFNLDKRNFGFPVFDTVFRDFFSADPYNKEMAGYLPAVNISEEETQFHIEFSAAGFDKGDFKIQLEDGTLTVSAEHKEEKTEEKTAYRRKEFNRSSFTRSFRLPEIADTEKTEAQYENGILKLHIQKKALAKENPVKEIKIA